MSRDEQKSLAELKAEHEERLLALKQQRAEIERRIRVEEQCLEAVKLLLTASGLEDLTTTPSIPEGRGRGRRGQGMADAVYEMLDKPMHAKEIWAELERRGYESKARDPVRMIGTLLGQDKRFIRVAQQTFARAGGTPLS
jgi:hypothetical protein